MTSSVLTNRITRSRRTIPKELQVSIFRRDRWLCHLCKRPVISAPAMKYLQRDLEESHFADLAYWRFAYHRQGAPLLDELAAVIDHIEVFSGGGLDVAENLATACNRCNMTRNNSELQSGWTNAQSGESGESTVSQTRGMGFQVCSCIWRKSMLPIRPRQKKSGVEYSNRLGKQTPDTISCRAYSRTSALLSPRFLNRNSNTSLASARVVSQSSSDSHPRP